MSEAHDPVTDRIHDNSWSADLEKPQHAGDPELVIEQAVDTIDQCGCGGHVVRAYVREETDASG